MATMISEVYDAFLASGAPEDKARKAAESMATHEGRFNGIEHDLGLIRGDINMIRGDINGIRGEINNIRGDIDNIRGDIDNVRGDINNVRGEVSTVRGEVNLLKWMNGITWALCFGIIFKLFLR